MKHLINSLSIFAVSLLCSCGEKDSEEALKEFKKEMEMLEVVIEQVTAVDMESVDGMKAFARFASKVEKVETVGLPADLKKAFEDCQEATTKMAEHIMNPPFPLELAEDEEALQEWITKKDPEFIINFEANVNKWTEKLDPLNEVGKTAWLDLEVAVKKHKIDIDISGLIRDLL